MLEQKAAAAAAHLSSARHSSTRTSSALSCMSACSGGGGKDAASQGSSQMLADAGVLSDAARKFVEYPAGPKLQPSHAQQQTIAVCATCAALA